MVHKISNSKKFPNSNTIPIFIETQLDYWPSASPTVDLPFVKFVFMLYGMMRE
jgi:hypothetical protein